MDRTDRQWRRVAFNVPDTIAGLWSVTMELQKLRLRLECNMIADAKVEYIEAFEALVSNQYVELLAWMRDWASKNMRDEETIGKVQALIRDQGRSVLSGHTCIGGADQLHIHHIVPRGYFGPERPDNIHDTSNLATVTRAEHEEIHRDWRAWVPRLREAIREGNSRV